MRKEKKEKKRKGKGIKGKGYVASYKWEGRFPNSLNPQLLLIILGPPNLLILSFNI
jgi:hypothetical protein